MGSREGSGRGDRRGGERGKQGSGARGGAAQRLVTELSAVEKALSKGDFAGQHTALEQVVSSLRSLRVGGLTQLDPEARGRLITTLSRVARQPKPAAAVVPAEAPAAPQASAAPAAEASPESPASGEEPPAEAKVPAATATEAEVAVEVQPPAEPPAGEQVVSNAQNASSEAMAPQTSGPSLPHVLLDVGRAWRAVGENDRAAAAFSAAGLQVPEEPPLSEAPPKEARRDGRASDKGRSSDKRRGAPARKPADRPSGRREARRDAPMALPPGADWRDQAKLLEERGRTRDAGHLHERHGGFADAVRLLEAGGDMRGAFRSAARANDTDAMKRLLAGMKPDEAVALLEKSGAHALLMEHHVAANRFDEVAKLYERAKQFDQAALAWERAEKWSQARKAFERVKDIANVERMRVREVAQLVERGDRLGAATVWVAAGQGQKAVEVLGGVPSSKAFRFLQKLGLWDEASALAKRELARAESEANASEHARWLELTGEFALAAAQWEKAARLDRAVELYAKLGETAKAAKIAEGAGLKAQAIELYGKLGDNEGVARAQQLADPTPRKSKPPPADSASPEPISEAE
ncbi:MAG: DEAD/DEAH box helicase [Myxococcaceae bacterium]